MSDPKIDAEVMLNGERLTIIAIPVFDLGKLNHFKITQCIERDVTREERIELNKLMLADEDTVRKAKMTRR